MTTDSADSVQGAQSDGAIAPAYQAAERPARTAPVVPRPGSEAGSEPGEPAGYAGHQAESGKQAPKKRPVPSARGQVAAPQPRYAAARRRRGAALSLAAADVAATAGTVLSCAGPEAAALLLAPVCTSLPALCARAGLYRPGLDPQALPELPPLSRRVAIAWCVGVTVLAACGRTGTLSLVALLAGIAVNAVLVCAARALLYGVRRRCGRRRPRVALVVGRGETARAVAAALAERPRYGLRPVALVEMRGTGAADGPRRGGASPADVTSRTGDAPDTHREGACGAVVLPELPLVGVEEAAREVAGGAVRDVVFVQFPWDDPHTAALASLLGERGVTGWLVRPGCASGAHGGHAAPGGRGYGETHMWGFSCHRLVLECPPPRTGLGKRLLDLALAAPALLLAAPVLAGCALAVRVLDGPDVLFRQERIGQDGRPFTLLKFRTVRPTDAHEAATRWTVAGDTRTSGVGRLLRRTSLDELPQLWNVLRGDMSLVGPRPERPYFVQQFSRVHPGYAQRHRAPVGLTGLAQIHGLRGDTSIADRARFDNHYIETWSLWQDVCIICRTATSFFRLEGR
ncbi:sugar transferase [Streptomyces oryzae]|uniref:Sugar transferase n=1 Tax=Streptomyces oryzae TaxID=1434886 RepID=A0ABS3XBU6_9ACTN|nr:sugar transferase [Streptomyces oryzae]MBO8192859.1 sugar transferase [Streptomyces oryzae]